MPEWFDVLLPVSVGFAVVLVSILVLRLHAFFALILAALVTAALTSDEQLSWQKLEEVQLTISYFDEEGNGYGQHYFRPLFLKEASVQEMEGGEFLPLSGAAHLIIYRPQAGGEPLVLICQRIAYAGDITTPIGQQLGGYAFELPPGYVPHPNDVYALENDVQRVFASAPSGIVDRVTNAFGKTVGSIGLIIAFAAVIGMCLLESGAADRIVRSALRLVGERGAPGGFAGCGFLLGIPVFFDTIFFLMIPLGKALRLRTGRNYILYILTIYCGATMAHSLVPPTPGPLLVAESLGVEVGLMMVVGLAVGLITAGYGILHASLVNRFITIPLRDTPEMPLARLEELAARADEDLPPLWLSLLPIILPVWLIGQQTAISMLRLNPPELVGDYLNRVPVGVFGLINFIGEKNIALGIGVIVGLMLLVWQTRMTRSRMRDRVAAALAAGGSIILITSAGGAFGSVLAETGIASMIQGLPDLGTVGLLTLAFLVTASIRTVQGSATVAMITAVGLFVGVSLPFHPVWLGLAIGCGSKPISWMNDSGFWVIGQMSGMTEIETLKTLTPITVMMGGVGLIVVILGAMRFPLT